MPSARRVIVIGLDGLEPTIVEPMLARGDLPNLARLRAAGSYSQIATTCPAQTPVAWSTFATGTNPGGHGIFDFIRRDPATYLPDLSLNRYERKNAFLPPRAVNLRQGTTIWNVLTSAGIESVVIRCPCTFPPDRLRGRMLSGMGVPDLRGGLGTGTFYTSRSNAVAGESEQLVVVERPGTHPIETVVIGPRHPANRQDIRATIVIEPQSTNAITITAGGGSKRGVTIAEGQWSDWLQLSFKVGMFQSVPGMVRFYLVALCPEIELYASPVNFDPDAPPFAISEPATYAKDLSRQIGTYYTTGMVEDHGALSNGRVSEEAFLQQCQDVLVERQRMLLHELERLRDGFLFCLFDTPDRIQHMFWRFREPGHPANAEGFRDDMRHVIEDHYRVCDDIVGRALADVNDRTLFVVLSDHGFSSFRRGVHLNTWLHDNGFLALKPGHRPGLETGDLFQQVDWNRTKAYALGIGSIYLNLAGREGNGIVPVSESSEVADAIVQRLSGLVDSQSGAVAVRKVSRREELYTGTYAHDAPDIVARFAAGYRASWSTALGGMPAGHFEDNTRRWAGDHIIDPDLVPGVLFMNRPFASGARLIDMAPTILTALGAPVPPAMEGRSLL